MQIGLDTALPRRIIPSNAAEFSGESACWYCPVCEKQRTTVVQPGGLLICPVCGGGPDWSKEGCKPTLAYESRYRRVADLCAKDSPWRKWADGVEQEYSEFLEATYRGMPARTKQTGWMYFSNAWKEVDKLGNYLLAAPNIPIRGIPHAYSEEGLQRRYYDSGRDFNIVTLSDVGLKPKFDDGGVQYTDDEAVELMTFDAADCERFMDEYFRYWFLDNIEDPLERNVAYWLSTGEGKRDIERLYGLSEQQVHTIVEHIAKYLKIA